MQVEDKEINGFLIDEFNQYNLEVGQLTVWTRTKKWYFNGCCGASQVSKIWQGVHGFQCRFHIVRASGRRGPMIRLIQLYTIVSPHHFFQSKLPPIDLEVTINKHTIGTSRRARCFPLYLFSLASCPLLCLFLIGPNIAEHWAGLTCHSALFPRAPTNNGALFTASLYWASLLPRPPVSQMPTASASSPLLDHSPPPRPRPRPRPPASSPASDRKHEKGATVKWTRAESQ